MNANEHANGLPGEGDAAPDDLNPYASEGPAGSSLAASLEEFLGLVKAGKRPSREEFLDRYGSKSGPLAECLDGLEFILSAAPDLDPAGPEGDDPSAAAGPLGPDARLGDYRVVREVGRGGMGVVYEAEQVSLGRRVALKVLPFAAALDPRQRQRFQLEAQAAAHLHHPHIVPVFAVGRDQGVHFYAMQFIEGRSLAGVVRELRRHARAAADPDRTGVKPASDRTPQAAPILVAATGSARVAPEGAPSASGGLTPSPGSSARGRAFFRAVARLGLQAAEALEHAHALGVIHRDVKPANLLLDARGDLYVTDFGLARFLDDPGLTRTGDLMGTLAYMSPEQALGRREVDHRTDIYSLGATLYEMLTLRTAFQGRDRQELLRKIAQDEPVRPRKLIPSVPLDLETVVLKAMDKEPSGRYPAAKELADDLRRFLDDEPVRARRPNLLEKAVKWSRRHRPVVVTAAVLLPLSMAIGSALLWAEQRRTADANQTLLIEQERTVAANRALRENVRDTFAIADQANMMAMERFTADAIAATGTDRPVEKTQFYKLALDYYKKVARLPATDTEMQAIIARAHQRIGFTLAVMYNPDFDRPFEVAVGVFESLIAREPRERAHRLNLAYALNEWAMMTTMMRGPSAAEPLYHRAIEIRKDLIRKGVALTPPRVDDSELESLGSYELSWADSLEGAGRVAEAEETRRSIFAFYKEIVPRLGSNLALRRRLAEAHRLPGLASDQHGNRRGAERYYRLALILDPDDPFSCNNLAWLLTGRPDEPPFDPAEAAPLARKAVAAQPEDGGIQNTLGVAEYRLGDFTAATQAFERSMALRYGGDPSDWLFLAMIQGREDHPAWAWYWYARAAEWLARNTPRNPDTMRFQEYQRFQDEAIALLFPASPVSKPSNSAVRAHAPGRSGRS